MAAAFDFLIGNTDRHDGNWMIKADGKMMLIDHGLTFPNTGLDDFRSYIFRNCTQESFMVPSEVATWSESKVKAAMDKHGIEPKAREGVLMRLARLKLHAGKEFAQMYKEAVRAEGGA